MKSVLFSIRPMHCERFAFGDKTDEIRKAAPLLPTPFKGYIYQTDGLWGYPILRSEGMLDLAARLEAGKKMVIGEFICDRVAQIDVNNSKEIAITSCLSLSKMWDYAKPKSLFDLKAIHATELKIYDKPVPVTAFHKPCPYKLPDGSRMDVPCPCDKYTHEFDEESGLICCTRRMKKPPQSWCYVEELRDGI